jgi:hypothetical protein
VQSANCTRLLIAENLFHLSQVVARNANDSFDSERQLNSSHHAPRDELPKKAPGERHTMFSNNTYGMTEVRPCSG